jgi:Zn-dependent peptidase ImmA (M78 family)
MKALRPAERMLMALSIERPDQIDLEAIAWTSGAAVKYRPLDQCEAMIVGTARRAIITVNSRVLPTRRRFSLAHEIGHWHHHRGRILVCGAADIENPARETLDAEKQADQFASDLILPRYLLRPRMTKMKRLTLSIARKIADEFKASLTATLLSMADADYFPIVIVCHNKQRRRWFRRAPMVGGWWFPKDDLDSESLAFEMLFGGAAETAYPRKIGADAWFEFRGVDHYEVQEQCFLLPNEEVLTLLIVPDEGHTSSP